MTRRSRWLDHEGHAWPITGHVCRACGLPLRKSTHLQTSHPNCDERKS